MVIAIVVVFILGYMMIALEHAFKINKAAIALLMGTALWVMYVSMAGTIIPIVDGREFSLFLSENVFSSDMSQSQKALKYIADIVLPEVLGDISSTLFFLIGAMTIVEIIDVHGGFAIITNRIVTKDKSKLLWIIAGLSFFMSSVLDNMTTAIVMVMMVRRIITNYKERWVFAGVIIMAVNGGGAMSPIGDITTILLWMGDNVTASHIISMLFIPSLISVVVPVFFASRMVKGVVSQKKDYGGEDGVDEVVTKKERLSIFIIGVVGLVSVPVFKTFTHLPPYMGMLLALSVIWIYTDIMYAHKSVKERLKYRVPMVLRNVDMTTILFFLGLLLSVSALEHIGVLSSVAMFLEEKLGNIYAINAITGMLSSVIDNVPIVAAVISMYPIATEATVALSSNPEFMTHFVVDGAFWDMLAYCAGVGGSILIIGSMAGVVVMGIEKISFMWYLKNMSLIALAGYLSGIGAYMLQYFILNGSL